MGKKGFLKTVLFFLGHPRHMRYLPRWLSSLAPHRNSINDELPWLTFGAIDWLDKKITGDDKIFEYGSGGSTLFLARCAGEIHSVEHNRAWYDQMVKVLKDRNITNVTLHLREPEKYTTLHHPYASAHYADKHFKHYAHTIDKFPNNYFSLIIIDGRARVQCALTAIKKIKSGGHLVLDNADRRRYREAIIKLDAAYSRANFYGMGPYNYWPWLTAVWEIR